jgi:hypothetical protein
MMSDYEYHGVAGGGLLVILILAIFWHACLTKMGEVLFGKINESPKGKPVRGFWGVLLFLFRGEYKGAGDERFIAICKKLRSLLCAYFGGIGAYIVFLVFERPIH